MKKLKILIFALMFNVFTHQDVHCCNGSMLEPFKKIGEFLKEVLGSLEALGHNPLETFKDILRDAPVAIFELTKGNAKLQMLSDQSLIKCPDTTNVTDIKEMSKKVESELNTVTNVYSGLSGSHVIQELEAASLICSTPYIMIAISVPYIGQSIAYLCNAMASTSIRVEMALANTEPVLDVALTARENLAEREKELIDPNYSDA